jgi:GntR family transcriptional regulator/MocR family aminotransferase
LRQAICQYIQSTRGLKCQAEQILITSGTQQAIHLSAQVLLNPGDVVALDEPGYDGALGAFLSHDLQIFDMDSDEEGMIIEPLHSQSNIGLVYSTPSHHFPLGKTMSLSRRLQLLDWAHQENKWIFEDDYNGEFRYHTRAIQSLQGLDQHQRVIYSGTFSKMLYPGFRLGFLVVPPALMDGFQVAKHFTDMCNSTLEQAILAEFIMEGAYAKHVRLVRQACAERQLALIEAIHRYLDDILTVQAADTGIHLLAQIQSGWHMTDVITASQALGFSVQPLSRYARKTLSKEAVLFGYAAHQPDQITAGIQQLANKIRQIKEAP